jgi:hypothetical protein
MRPHTKSFLLWYTPVLRASGPCFSGDKNRVMVSIGTQRQKTEWKKFPVLALKKRAEQHLVFNQAFSLYVCCLVLLRMVQSDL